MVDVKLIALQAGTFGRRFATRFPPLTFVACVASAVTRRLVAAVSQEAGATLTVMIGALVVRLAATGAHQRYVRSGMGPWLILSGIILIAIGGFVLVRSLLRRPQAASVGRIGDAEDEHVHVDEPRARPPRRVDRVAVGPAGGDAPAGRPPVARLVRPRPQRHGPPDPTEGHAVPAAARVGHAACR